MSEPLECAIIFHQQRHGVYLDYRNKYLRIDERLICSFAGVIYGKVETLALIQTTTPGQTKNQLMLFAPTSDIICVRGAFKCEITTHQRIILLNHYCRRTMGPIYNPWKMIHIKHQLLHLWKHHSIKSLSTCLT